VSEYRLTPAARADLIDIWNYTAQSWSLEQAEKYLLDLEEHLIQLALNPDIGKHRPEIREGYYSFPAAQHVVFYLKAVDHIQVIGILHGRMDVNTRLR